MVPFRTRSVSLAVLVAGLGLAGCAADTSADNVAGSSDELTKTRLGPKTTPQSIKLFEGQKGGIWELPNGDILTSFDVGRAWTHTFSLRTIQGTTVTPAPNVSSGQCVDHGSGMYYGCRVGPGSTVGTEPMGWGDRRQYPSGYFSDAEVEDRAVMLTDALYVAQATYVPGPPAKGGPGIVRIDPATGAQSVLMMITVADAFGGKSPRETYYRMRELPGGKLAFSYRGLGNITPNSIAKTLVVAKDGSVVRQHDGWLVESRPGSAEVLLADGAAVSWWDAATDVTTPAPNMPWSNNVHIARNGDVVIKTQTEVGYFTRDGSIAKRTPIGWGAVDVLAVLPDGGYIAQESNPQGEVIRLNDPRKASVIDLSTRASILAETKWTLGANSFRLPTYEGAGAAVADDEGNSYVSYHRRRNDGVYDSYVVSFDAKGQRRWGAVASDSWQMCIPWTVLSGSRLAMRCATAYSGRMVLLGP